MKNRSLEGPRLSLRVLSDDQIYAIHLAALEILERTGIIVESSEALEMLDGEGAFVTKPNRAKIPSYLVDRALQSVPKRISIANRDGERVMLLEGDNTYFGSPVDCPKIIDPYTKKIRDFERRDTRSAALLAEFLPNIDFVAVGGMAADIPPETASREIFKETVRNTKKPIVFCAFDEKGARDIIEMATGMSGGEEILKQNPFIIHYSEPITPLKHGNEGVKKIFLCAEKGVPLIYIPMLMAGATAPSTFAGILALCTSEVLSGLVMQQLKKEGSPFIFGGIPSVMDMSTMIYAYGAPELDLMSAALTDIAHYYHLPMFGTAGCGDAKSADQQTAIEVSISCLMSILSGAHLIHDVGLIGSGKIVSLETVVMGDEIVDMIRHALKPIDINNETLPIELINSVAPGGNYLTEDHTLRHFKEWWYPKLMDRKTLEKWFSDRKQTFGERLNEKVIQIIEHHSASPLSKAVTDLLKSY